ncbi:MULTISPECIES: hypothetical protein [unclassified Streptomyces]|uniref:hypothetical protein n=1 Tax=unclassified Streptomyces TaxID=2593676 RepID=UPI002E8022F7|nr:hypothetical protein [Streptomyces sp. NBC_00589]WTI35603.1 hypothetical protein OIC96_11640 [Streptomyces sp. NBC_00775]WUB30724.1 hypothetical protein OHA51_38090 [Streptomyces sp. NBC_00589]
MDPSAASVSLKHIKGQTECLGEEQRGGEGEFWVPASCSIEVPGGVGENRDHQVGVLVIGGMVRAVGLRAEWVL